MITETTFPNLVLEELRAARKCHAAHRTAHESYAVILEELEEFWEQVRLKPDARDHLQMLQELVQIGAMAQRAAEDTIMPIIGADNFRP